MLLVGVTACSPTVRHSPSMAREEAERFAKVALIDRDFENAYAIFANDQKQGLPLDRFRALINDLHPTGFPSTVRAMDFEPVAEANGMNIYLYGENGKQKFYYHFSMEGTEKTGYKVAGVWRDERPYTATVKGK